jgi:glycine/D-amino acid oxidase-like deaminating enzyme
MNNSFWWQSLPEWESRPQISSALEVDVAIIGAGYTGLWSAHFLKQLNAELSIAVFESEHVGFGASGRNGGWASALWPVSLTKIAKQFDSPTAHNFQFLLNQLVAEFMQTLTELNLDAEQIKAGTLNLARSASQLQRIQQEKAQYSGFGFDDQDYQLITNLSDLPAATNVLAGLFSPHCAAINPAKLVRSLAEHVENLGVQIFENSKVTKISPKSLNVNEFAVSTKQIVIATEGYSHSLLPRSTAPIHSLMFITDPIPADLLDQLRIPKGLTFSDARNLVIYGQRTATNQIAFGGRGAPYRFGSRTGTAVEIHKPAFQYLQNTLIQMLPELTSYAAEPSHVWGGPIGVSRDWQPSVSFNPATGIARAGNYVGDGVTASYLAGKTLADLMTSKTTNLTAQPWVNHNSKNWEAEPLRYALINAARIAISSADKLEQSTKGETIFSKILWRLLKS